MDALGEKRRERVYRIYIYRDIDNKSIILFNTELYLCDVLYSREPKHNLIYAKV